MTACLAPASALYFRPDGLVTSCCSGWHVLGRVNGPTRRSLRQIWDGVERAQLDAALAEGDFELGCFECGRLAAAGRRRDSLAHHFDRYSRSEPRSYPAMMDFALSNRCNLQCVQCNGSFSSSIRRVREGRAALPPAYDDQFFDELDDFLPHLERAQFKGGEPFLAPENRRIWDEMLQAATSPEICVTTNGTIFNAQVERYTQDLGFDLIVSVDAVDPAVLSSIRVGIDPGRLWANVDRFRAITRANGRSLTLSFCLMSLSWHQLAEFLATADRLGAQPDVIWVDGPGHVNLLTVPHDELVRILEGLEAHAPQAAGLSPASRTIWDDALHRVRVGVEQGEAGASVELRAPPPPRATGDRKTETAALLRSEHGGPVLEVCYRNDVICSVTPDPWTTWLHPQSWVGHGLDETMMVISADAGVTMRSTVESIEGGAHRIELTFEGDDARRTLQGVHLPDPDVQGTSHLLLAEVTAATHLDA